MSVSVIIPALNEQDAIEATVRQVIDVLNAAGERDFEVIVVDDGSRDRTGEIAQAAGARVVRHAHNLGYGRSLKDGVRAARNDIIVITDADGTYPIKDIPKLVALYRQGYDMVVGERTGAEYRESALKMPLRAVLRRIVEFTAMRKIPDINSGLRVFRREHAVHYEDKLCDTFSYTTGLTLSFMMNGLFVTYIPIDYYKRIGQTKVRLLTDSFKTFQYICEAAVYYNPLRIFGAMSVALIAMSVLMLAVNFIFHSLGLFLLSIGSILAAIIVFSIGLLATILKQMLVEQERHRRPAIRPLSVVSIAPSSAEQRERVASHDR
jgi:glycosyltransferase involved in cell wall biosynthesis